MFYSEVRKRNRNGLIKRVIVIRFLRNFVEPKKSAQSGRESDFAYLLIFLPTPGISDQDIFLMRDRAGERHKQRLFKSLFTVSQALADWGFDEYTVFDAAGYTDWRDAISEIVRRGYGVKAFELLLKNISSEIISTGPQSEVM